MTEYVYCVGGFDEIGVDPDTAFSCPAGIGLRTSVEQILFENQDVYVPFDFTQMDSAVATDLFIAGFILALAPLAAAFGFSQLLKLLK